MRLRPTAAVASLLLLLLLMLTWLSLRAINGNAELFDRAINALDRYTSLESALQRDVLSARAGMLRNYDRLVSEVNALNASLSQLREIAAIDDETARVLDHLEKSTGQQEELVEQLKSDNALLQNSLAYFELFSARLGAPDRVEPVNPTVTSLAAAMLHLTLDTTSATVREVGNRLDELADQPHPPGDADSIRGLLAHGRLLHDLLPATDDILKALYETPREPDRESLRTLIQAHQVASRTTARRFRLALYAVSVALVLLLVQLGLRLRAGTRALQRRANFEHVIAGISMRFINASPHETDANIRQALIDMAECVGADRAYFVRSEQCTTVYTWCRQGASFMPGWPEQAPAFAARFRPAIEGVVHIPLVSRLAPGEGKDALTALRVKGWACASSSDEHGPNRILGFDALRGPCRFTRSGELGLLPTALESIENAVRRQIMEREQLRLETRLQHARRMEAVGALASGIAHNFNNILGAILGYAEMAETQLNPGEGRNGNLAEIRRAAERARDLIDQILAFGRPRGVRRHSVNVQTMIAEAASLLRASLPPTIQLMVRSDPEPATVLGEPAQLQQVVLNLCNNAAQAMNGSGRIEVDIEMCDTDSGLPLSHGNLAPGRYVRIAVRDSGSGMSDVTMGRIFEPFFTTRRTGNGLGLATVREIVREHGGAMNVQSAPGTGSRFESWLPRSGLDISASGEDRAAAARHGRGECVLVIEAERSQLLRDEEILAALGFEPVGYTAGADALVAFRASRERFDMILVGHITSTTIALEIAAAIHEAAPALPILLATASADQIGADALLTAGICEVLGWPISSADIAPALIRCLGKLPAPLAVVRP
jgi:signal transduction histidine kinase/CheY-like chemotaxis protein